MLGLILINTMRIKVSAISLYQFIHGKVSADILHKQFGHDKAHHFAVGLSAGLFPCSTQLSMKFNCSSKSVKSGYFMALGVEFAMHINIGRPTLLDFEHL